jgi:tetratricopeptide (TPR) repeat protein
MDLTMEYLGIGNADIFSTTIQQTAQAESLANSALSRGIDLYMRQDYEDAIREFRRSIGLAPNSAYSTDASSYMAKSYMALGDTEGAVKAYEIALKRNPNRDDIYVSLGNLHFSEGRYEEAIYAYDNAVRIWNSSDNHYALGQAYMNADRYSDADREFNAVLRMDPNKPNGYYGLGLNFSRQGRFDDAIVQFKEAIRQDKDFYDAYAELGYAYSDIGEMGKAQNQLNFLEKASPELADTLSRYMYRVDPPKFMFAHANSDFNYYFPLKTPLSSLDVYLSVSNTNKTFSITLQFNKEMERESVENIANWQITRAIGHGPGQAYNFGLPIPSTEITLSPVPQSVYYDENKLSAIVFFNVRQNASADGTIDPMHIEFKFSGKDIFGYEMDPDHDQFTGFAGSF